MIPATDRLDDLPPPSQHRLAVRVSPDALRRIRGGHPWVYDRSIRGVNRDDGAPGDLGIVFDQRRRFVGIGLWDPDSPIRLRMVHVGDPVTIDHSWFAGRIAASVARRGSLLEPYVRRGSTPAPGYRAVNGENDGLPALIVDCYGDVAVIKLYSALWFPHLRAVIESVRASTQVGGVVVRMSRHVQHGETFGLDDGDVVAGAVPDGPVLFTENRLTIEADVRHGQKTGYFLDQRRNRLHVQRLARGKRVLDVFASTGGFTVHAAAGGARTVHAVDISRPTLDVVERNLAHNANLADVAACSVTTEAEDAFDAMRGLARAHRRFDLVVVDPPSFASKAAAVGRARSAYARLTKLAIDLLAPRGVLVQASCSSRIDATDFFAIVNHAAIERRATLTELRRTGHDIDHPVAFDEGNYLKAGFWRVERRR